jgi:hypothetical protein
MVDVSIKGIGIYVQALSTNSKANVINILRTTSRLLKISFALLNKLLYLFNRAALSFDSLLCSF